MTVSDTDEMMTLISAATNARDAAMAAMASSRAGKFAQADQRLALVGQYVQQAQDAHTHLLTLEARGELPQVKLLLVHAESYLTNAATMQAVATEFQAVYQRLADANIKK
ncbi:PTS lactose/cellobiose transporter subunit IIA [Lacticaseibacillus pantheris]|uniref:PTS lactose/cellobiose transporter subunit IIA n=1 Tax=Lacticaseibacillus pantheris TaxID=171523 RepID=UPI00265B2E2D|nr:PTS lactose/cellobiose transporter subunit IIA [Lacticaseibacillus pantheris]WKF84269.1 PTS lactose/cellobiose transporter subunit IIA [Lacticaseibacillus pantheris]